jgi:hypothetical protein
MGSSDPFKLYTDVFKQMAAVEKLQPTLKLHMEIARINSHFQSVSKLEREFLTASKLLQHGTVASAAAKAMPDFSAVDQCLKALSASSYPRIADDFRKWERLWDRPAFQRPAAGWSASMADLSVAATRASLGDPLLSRLFAPASAFTKLANRTAQRIDSASSDEVKSRLGASLDVIEAQLVGHTSTLASAIDSAIGIEEDQFAIDVPLTLGRREQIEMLEAEVSDSTDLVQLAQAAPSTNVNTLAREVVELVVQCNEHARMRSLDDVFKLTNRLLQVASQLPWIDAKNGVHFGQFLDGLYFILYEGAGKDHLRYMKAWGGPLDDDACEVVFIVKHLRNKWLRHDPEHGDQKSIKKSYEQLRERFKELGLAAPPRRASDYRRLQARLLKEVHTFLVRLFDELERAGSAP